MRNLIEYGADIKKMVRTGVTEKIQELMKRTANDGLKHVCKEVLELVA